VLLKEKKKDEKILKKSDTSARATDVKDSVMQLYLIVLAAVIREHLEKFM